MSFPRRIIVPIYVVWCKSADPRHSGWVDVFTAATQDQVLDFAFGYARATGRPEDLIALPYGVNPRLHRYRVTTPYGTERGRLDEPGRNAVQYCDTDLCGRAPSEERMAELMADADRTIQRFALWTSLIGQNIRQRCQERRVEHEWHQYQLRETA